MEFQMVGQQQQMAAQMVGQQQQQQNAIVYQVQSSVPRLVKQEGRDWSTSLCGCFDDCGVCIGVTCCPLCYGGCCISQKLGESCCIPLLIGFLPLRLKVRWLLGIKVSKHKYFIWARKGSVCGDCCVLASFLAPCAICQIAREMKNVGWL